MGLTLGEKLVGVDFNVDNRGDVTECKNRFAFAINQLEELYKSEEVTEGKASIIEEAKMRILDAQMWAVKAITYNY